MMLMQLLWSAVEPRPVPLLRLTRPLLAREAEREQRASPAEPQPAAAPDPKHGAQTEAERELIRENLHAIYSRVAPHKVGSVAALVSGWEGEERLLLAKVRSKWRRQLHDAPLTS